MEMGVQYGIRRSFSFVVLYSKGVWCHFVNNLVKSHILIFYFIFGCKRTYWISIVRKRVQLQMASASPYFVESVLPPGAALLLRSVCVHFLRWISSLAPILKKKRTTDSLNPKLGVQYCTYPKESSTPEIPTWINNSGFHASMIPWE